MTRFYEQIGKVISFSDEAKCLFNEMVSSRELKKGELLLPIGGLCNHLYFVEKGLIRTFYLKEGKDVTEWIALDGTFCFSIISFFEKSPSRLGIECLEDSLIVQISRDKLMEYSETNLEIARLLRRFTTGSLILSQLRMESIQFETAKQRYKRLLKEHPELIRRVPLMYIASFLGISFETLSRIRASID